MLKVITTVGASLFENFLKKNNSIKNQYETIKDEPYSARKNYQDEIEQIKKEIIPFLNDSNASAEIKSLLKIKEKYQNEEMFVYLICTDTLLSFLSAQILKDFYHNSVLFNCLGPIVIKKLSFQNIIDFERAGLSNLVTKINEIIRGDNSSSKFVFNITGGYKGIIPFLTIIGQLLSIDIYYIFETTNDLIYIPQLPIQFDTTLAEKHYYSLDLFKNNQNNKLNKELFEELKKIGFTANVGERQIITGLGHIFMQFIENNMTVAKSILGHIVELKLFEFYIRNSEKNFSFVEQGNEDLNVGDWKKRGGEIDILLKKSSSDNITNSVVIEVKSAFQFINDILFEKVLAQFKCKLKLINEQNYKPSEYRFFIHTIDLWLFNGGISNNLKDKFKEVQYYTKGVNVRFFFVYINLKFKENDNPYSEFMSTKLEHNTNIKEIIIS